VAEKVVAGSSFYSVGKYALTGDNHEWSTSPREPALPIVCLFLGPFAHWGLRPMFELQLNESAAIEVLLKGSLNWEQFSGESKRERSSDIYAGRFDL
jgi:hypothetical protein